MGFAVTRSRGFILVVALAAGACTTGRESRESLKSTYCRAEEAFTQDGPLWQHGSSDPFAGPRCIDIRNEEVRLKRSVGDLILDEVGVFRGGKLTLDKPLPVGTIKSLELDDAGAMLQLSARRAEILAARPVTAEEGPILDISIRYVCRSNAESLKEPCGACCYDKLPAEPGR